MAKYQTVQSTRQYKVSDSTKYKTVQSTRQYKVPDSTKYQTEQSTRQNKVWSQIDSDRSNSLVWMAPKRYMLYRHMSSIFY